MAEAEQTTVDGLLDFSLLDYLAFRCGCLCLSDLRGIHSEPDLPRGGEYPGKGVFPQKLGRGPGLPGRGHCGRPAAGSAGGIGAMKKVRSGNAPLFTPFSHILGLRQVHNGHFVGYPVLCTCLRDFL